MKEKLEMVIFDLDGTLWETTDITYKSANEILKKHNINYEISKETVASSMGYTLQECAEAYLPYLDEEYRIKLMIEMLEYNSEKLLNVGGNVYTNLKETLIELNKKYKLAIVSNCGAGYIESFLATSGFEKYFVDFIAAAKMQVSKGEAIKRMMERNNVKNAIYVGDTQRDYEATKMAGIDFIHAKYGFGSNLNFEYFIEDIKELPNVLEKM